MWEFLGTLTKAPKVFSAAVAFGAAVAAAWSLRLFGLPAIDATGLTFVAVSGTALAFFVLSTSVHAWQHLNSQPRLPPMSKLTEQQQSFLKNIHSTGQREFTMPYNSTSQNWLMDLVERGYVEYSFSGGGAARYEVTSLGWAAMDRQFKS